jgi:hypothetical protein
MIESETLEWLLFQFDTGASTAENDPLLEVAKIETQQFHDLYWQDRIDIIKGIKGAGKTALYRLCYFLRKHLIDSKKLYCIFGVEASGDPVFRLYQKEFDDYTEIEFENFWNIYFITLVYSLVSSTKQLKEILQPDLAKIDSILSEIGLKVTKSGFTLKDSINAIQKIFRSVKVKVGVRTDVDPSTAQIKSVSPLVEIEPRQAEDISVRPLYVAGFRDVITSIVASHGITIWVMLDRLDEVFPHRSDVEKTGLRGLLKASYNFSHPNLRIKIFLRDDIIGYLASEGFTALTHVTDRCSSTMSWSQDELLYLVIKRISSIQAFERYFKIEKQLVDSQKDYREKLFYTIFPKKIGTTPTMDWIYSNCADSNNIVTPRDIIDFFKFAKAEQLKQFKLNPKDQEHLILPDTFKKALEELSKHKKDTFLFAEFPHFKDIFLKFEGNCSEYDQASLAALLGKDHLKVIDDLKSIGFLKYIPKSGTFRIPVIWRKGLNIRRKKMIAMKA